MHLQMEGKEGGRERENGPPAAANAWSSAGDAAALYIIATKTPDSRFRASDVKVSRKTRKPLGLTRATTRTKPKPTVYSTHRSNAAAGASLMHVPTATEQALRSVAAARIRAADLDEDEDGVIGFASTLGLEFVS